MRDKLYKIWQKVDQKLQKLLLGEVQNSPEKSLGELKMDVAYLDVTHPSCPECGTELEITMGNNRLECPDCQYRSGS